MNHFDGDAGGSDTLRGGSGDDAYWLGRGTGHDVVDEVSGNTGTGDTGDEIRVKAGIAPFSGSCCVARTVRTCMFAWWTRMAW